MRVTGWSPRVTSSPSACFCPRTDRGRSWSEPDHRFWLPAWAWRTRYTMAAFRSRAALPLARWPTHLTSTRVVGQPSPRVHPALADAAATAATIGLAIIGGAVATGERL